MRRQIGLTLMETAVVLTIVGLIIGSLLVPFTTQIDDTKIERTNTLMESVKTALIDYTIAHNRLPCPAANSNSGEAVALGDPLCTQQGFLPWANLGVEKSDVWGNSLRYRVYPAFTEVNGIIHLTTGSSNLAIEVNGSEQIPATLIDNVIAVVFSYGKNGRYAFLESPFWGISQAYAADPVDNAYPCGENNTKLCYVSNRYVPNGFDDSIVWLTQPMLLERLVTAGKLQVRLANSPPTLDLTQMTVSLPSGGLGRETGGFPLLPETELGNEENLPVGTEPEPGNEENLPVGTEPEPGNEENLPVGTEPEPGNEENLPVSTGPEPGNEENLPVSTGPEPENEESLPEEIQEESLLPEEIPEEGEVSDEGSLNRCGNSQSNQGNCTGYWEHNPHQP